MTTKPTAIVEFATDTTVEPRKSTTNKIEPSELLKQYGTLSGLFSLNNFNWMFNAVGLWQQFLNELLKFSDGAGVGLSVDDHAFILFAVDSTAPSKYLIGTGYKTGAGAPVVQAISSATLTFGTPLADGTVPVSGATAANIFVLALNFKKS